MYAKTTVAMGVRCPNCENKDFSFAGVQYGYGFVPDMELWTCIRCGSTFSKVTMEVFSGTADEL
ncbi:MAG: hypothetical protein ACE5KK_00100 [Candidatus Brocadiales bacterium]